MDPRATAVLICRHGGRSFPMRAAQCIIRAMQEGVHLSARLLSRIVAAYFAILGLICGIVYSVVGAAFDITNNQVGSGTALAFLALAGMPILAALIGWVIGFILAGPVRYLLRKS